MKKNAFEQWVTQVSANDPKIAAQLLKRTLFDNFSPENMVWALLECVANGQLTNEAFLKAAEYCLRKNEDSNLH
jgi:hypothetical protein